MGVITIGAGIAIGAGIQADAPVAGGGGGGSPTPDSFTVATLNNGSYDYYGAYNYTSGSSNLGIADFGVVTSDYIYGVFLYTDNSMSYSTSILLNNGTYSGFSVVNGAIDNDVSGYPRVFTIGGVNYTAYYSGSGAFYYLPNGSDVLGLAASVGSTVSVVYNPGIQLTIPSGSIYVGTYTPSLDPYYGASRVVNQFGFVNTDYISDISWVNLGFTNFTTIKLVPGTYTGFTVAADGTIDGDTSGSKVFTVDGTNATFSIAGNAPNYTYSNTGNPFSLNTKTGQVITTVYDPAQNTGGGGGGGASAFTTGTITVGFNGFDTYGYAFGQYGSSSFSPPTDPVIDIKFDSAYMPSGRTQVSLISGTYNGVVIDNSTYTVDGESTITVTIDGVSAELTLAGSLTATVAGDPFSLQAKNTQTLNVSMVAGTVAPAATASGTLTVGYNNMDRYGYQPYDFGSVSISPDMIRAIYYFTMGNDTSIGFTSGTYGSVVVSNSPATIDGETSVTVTIDGIAQTGTLMSGGSGPSVLISGDPYGLQSKNGQTLTVTVNAGAGGGGTTYTSMGNWMSSGFNSFGPNWQVTFGLSGGVNSALLSSLNALTAGSTFSITDSGNTTVSVTVQSTSGQPWMSGSAVSITVNSPPGGTMSMPSIYSITI